MGFISLSKDCFSSTCPTGHLFSGIDNVNPKNDSFHTKLKEWAILQQISNNEYGPMEAKKTDIENIEESGQSSIQENVEGGSGVAENEFENALGTSTESANEVEMATTKRFEETEIANTEADTTVSLPDTEQGPNNSFELSESVLETSDENTGEVMETSTLARQVTKRNTFIPKVPGGNSMKNKPNNSNHSKGGYSYPLPGGGHVSVSHGKNQMNREEYTTLGYSGSKLMEYPAKNYNNNGRIVKKMSKKNLVKKPIYKKFW